MAIFNSYVKLPEGTGIQMIHPDKLGDISRNWSDPTA